MKSRAGTSQLGLMGEGFPVRLAGHVVTTSLGITTSVGNDDDLTHIWNDILDRQLTELDNRFQKDQCGIMRAAATFLPQSKTFAQKESLLTMCDHYHISVEDAELAIFIEQLRSKVPSLVAVFVLLTFFKLEQATFSHHHSLQDLL